MRRGSYPDQHAESTFDMSIQEAEVPNKVIIPLSSNQDVHPCYPLVSIGDEIKRGQKIGDGDSEESTPVHSSVSGRVITIEPHWHPLGKRVPSVEIEVMHGDGPEILPESEEISDPEPDEFIRRVREYGLPFHTRLRAGQQKTIETILVNGTEFDPYITSAHQTASEYPHHIIWALSLLTRVVSAKRAIICIEKSKMEIYERLRAAVKNLHDTAVQSKLNILLIKKRLPLSAEYPLARMAKLKILKNRKPIDQGFLVLNIHTLYDLYEAFINGKPKVDAIVTVVGSGIRISRNMRIRIGTLFTDIIHQCGGRLENIGRLMMGGGMTGITQFTPFVPVVKETVGIMPLIAFILDENESHLYAEGPCIRCAKCNDICPVHLMPNEIAGYGRRRRISEAIRYGALSCIECGQCSYVCPSRIPLSELIRSIRIQAQEMERQVI
ncbi:MAG: RnfABCDGE type electron transport complex subunit C [bacterium]